MKRLVVCDRCGVLAWRDEAENERHMVPGKDRWMLCGYFYEMPSDEFLQFADYGREEI